MPGEHILVIDDCRTVRELMAELLSEQGYTCDLAEDGGQALTMAQEHTPDLVLVDFIMPRMNGLQFMRSFRSVENQRDIPVVLVSVKADTMGENFMRTTGAVDALTKPFSPDGLKTVVQHALSADRSGAAEAREARRPFLSADGYEPEELPDAEEESAAALERIREKLAVGITENLTADDEEEEDEPLERLIGRALTDELLCSLVDDYGRVDPGGGVASFSGSTEAVSVGEVMQLLLHGRAQGTLQIQGPGMRALIYCQNGRVALARLEGGPEEFLLGRYLLKEELVTRGELRRLLESPGDGRPLGERLVRSGYISREDLVQALTEQTTEVLYEMLKWQSARYRFIPGPLPEEAGSVNLDISVGELLMEGLRRVDEWRIIEKNLPDFDEVLTRTPAGVEALGPDATLSPDEARVLDFVNGVRTVREIIRRTRLGSFEVCKVLNQLITMKVVKKVEQ
jgi:CheY-like chemotaxis protein